MAPASSLGPAVLIRTALSPTKLARVVKQAMVHHQVRYLSYLERPLA
ncbi:hypothetical protein ABIE89_000604 [Bradyrhizobium niftali]